MSDLDTVEVALTEADRWLLSVAYPKDSPPTLKPFRAVGPNEMDRLIRPSDSPAGMTYIEQVKNGDTVVQNRMNRSLMLAPFAIWLLLWLVFA